MNTYPSLLTRLTAYVTLFAFMAGTCFGQQGLPLPQGELEPEEPAASTAPITAANGDDSVNDFNIVDQETQSVLKLVEMLTGKSIISQQNLPAVKISFTSSGPMTKQEALVAVESLLSLNGIALTPIGDKFIKAASFQDVVRQVPEFLEGKARDYPTSEKFYTMLVKLDYLNVSTSEYLPILTPIMSAPPIGNIVALPKANALLLTDTLINLQRVESVLERADLPQDVNEEVLFYPLHNMQARELQARLQSLLLNQSSSLSKYFLNNTTIESDERTNQIIVLTHPSNVRLLDSIIESFDIVVEPQTASEVFYIKHAQALEIESLLEEVVTGQQQARQDAPDNTVTPGQPAVQTEGQAPPPPPPSPAAALDILDTANLQFSAFVTIVADERSNAVVVYGTHSDIKQLGELIDKIDVVLAQVMIEVLIAEVTLRQGEVNGLTSLSLRGNGTTGGIVLQTQSPSIGDTPAFNVTTSLDLNEFSLALGPALSSGKLRVLQAPVLATTHNQEASVNVSERRPFVTGSTTSNINPDATTNTVQFEDVGIELTVKPLIGSDGIVQLEIEQIVENPTAEVITINGVPQPVIAKREAKSFVSVTDQQVIVLAGLQESNIARTDQKVFLLGDIPILGEIFNSRDDDNTRRELMIFIKPNVIYTQKDATKIAERTLTNLDNGDMARKYLENPDMSAIYEIETEKPPPKTITRKQKSSSPRRN